MLIAIAYKLTDEGDSVDYGDAFTSALYDQFIQHGGDESALKVSNKRDRKNKEDSTNKLIQSNFSRPSLSGRSVLVFFVVTRGSFKKS